MSDAVIAALAGVVVGALLNYALSYQAERRREKLVERATARLVERSLLEAFVHIRDGQEKEVWPPSEDFQFKTERWPELRRELARVLTEDLFFDTLDDAFLFLETENAAIRKGTTYDAKKLERLRSQIQSAVWVTDWFKVSRRELLKRRWKALRHGRQESLGKADTTPES